LDGGKFLSLTVFFRPHFRFRSPFRSSLGDSLRELGDFVLVVTGQWEAVETAGRRRVSAADGGAR
jgi:hypothetical protein